MIAAETDTEKVEVGGENLEPSEFVDDMTDYSAQLVCAVAFHVPAFRNLGLKRHLTEAAGKLLHIKSRECGKYELAKRVAISFAKKGYVQIESPVNFTDMTREQIIIVTEFELPCSLASHKSSVFIVSIT